MKRNASSGKPPLPVRAWFIVLAALFLLTGFSDLFSTDDPEANIACLVIGGLMLFSTWQTIKGRKEKRAVSEPKASEPVFHGNSTWINLKPAQGIKVSDYIGFDVETTGLSREFDRVIEIGAVKCVNNEIVDRFTTFINPGIFIPARITKLTGITNSDVARAPAFHEIAPGLMRFIGDLPIVAHNANFDAGFLANELNRAGYDFTFSAIDTLTISRKLFPDLENHKLKTVVSALELSPLEQQHRALDDAELAHSLFQRCKAAWDPKSKL